jgi:hypothetical protein
MENIPEYHTRQQSTENLNNGTLNPSTSFCMPL